MCVPFKHDRSNWSYVNGEVFVYTLIHANRDEENEDLPNSVSSDVVSVRVDPSVTSIPANAFKERKKLAEVELCEGVVEIGAGSFENCDHSITKINIPNSLRRIKYEAFSDSLQTPIRLHDGIESIGEFAFSHCIFMIFRLPPLITLIAEGMICNCRPVFSVEIPENVRDIGNAAFGYCICLRNVAFPPNAIFGDNIFIIAGIKTDTDTDLYQLFGSNASIIWELQHRFDGLPIHQIVYYQSYNQGVLQRLIAAINMRSGQRRTLRSKLDPTGNQQDRLGMTPLHILACSSVHDLEVYRLIVENYPTNLITKDRWGALPLLYVFWGAAPNEIIEFMIDSYQWFYPDHVFNWTDMVWTMGRTDTPKESIEKLLCVNQMHFPEQPIDWEYLLDEFVYSTRFSFRSTFIERMQFLVKCGLSDRVEALAFKVWRDCITNMIQTSNFGYNRDNSVILHLIREKLAYFEEEHPKLEEATTILELALWKVRMTENKIIHHEVMYRRQKKVKSEESSIRSQCRATCGASVIIEHVLPFLITAED
jgi:hypothetical protein